MREAPQTQGTRRTAIRVWYVVYLLIVSAAIVFVATLIGIRVANIYRSGTGPEDVRIPVLKDAVRANSQDADVRRELASVYRQSGQPGAALREYKKILEKDDNDVGALYAMSVIYREQGKDGEARELLRRLLAVDADHSRGAVLLAELELDAGDQAAAREALMPAMAAHREIAELHYLYGVVLEREDDASGAKQQYRIALELMPELDSARRALAKLEEQ